MRKQSQESIVSLPFHQQLIQLPHDTTQPLGEAADFVEGQVELPQRRAADAGVKGHLGANAVPGDVERAQRQQGQQLHRQRLELVALQVQPCQVPQVLHTRTHGQDQVNVTEWPRSIQQRLVDKLPGTGRRGTPAGSCGSGPGGAGVPAAAGRSRCPSSRTGSPARCLTGPASGSSPCPSAVLPSSPQSRRLRRRQTSKFMLMQQNQQGLCICIKAVKLLDNSLI